MIIKYIIILFKIITLVVGKIPGLSYDMSGLSLHGEFFFFRYTDIRLKTRIYETSDFFREAFLSKKISSHHFMIFYMTKNVYGEPLGLETSWTTATASTGKFRVVLKHQPDLKSATSASTAGETDLDIEFDINIQ